MTFTQNTSNMYHCISKNDIDLGSKESLTHGLENLVELNQIKNSTYLNQI